MRAMLTLVLALFSVFVCTACDDMDTPTDGGIDGGGDPGVTITGTLTEFGAGVVVAGAEACLGDTATCVTSDAMGVYVFDGYPTSTEAYITVTATGYLPLISPMFATEDAAISIQLLSDGVVAAFELAIADEFEPETAYLAAGVFMGSGGVDGAAFVATPSGVGPVYLGGPGLPDPALTETSTSGRAGWIDLPPGGTGEVTLTPPSGAAAVTCTRSPLAWPGSTELSTRYPLVAGHLSGVFNFTCM